MVKERERKKSWSALPQHKNISKGGGTALCMRQSCCEFMEMMHIQSMHRTGWLKYENPKRSWQDDTQKWVDREETKFQVFIECKTSGQGEVLLSAMCSQSSSMLPVAEILTNP